jgi:hypothetical protein
MTQEVNLYQPKWKLITDKGEHEISEKEMEMVVKAEQAGARFVFFGEFMLNLAFLKEAYKITPHKPSAVWDEELKKPTPVKN